MKSNPYARSMSRASTAALLAGLASTSSYTTCIYSTCHISGSEPGRVALSTLLPLNFTSTSRHCQPPDMHRSHVIYGAQYAHMHACKAVLRQNDAAQLFAIGCKHARTALKVQPCKQFESLIEQCITHCSCQARSKANRCSTSTCTQQFTLCSRSQAWPPLALFCAPRQFIHNSSPCCVVAPLILSSQ
jgi:hypothetical protein